MKLPDYVKNVIDRASGEAARLDPESQHWFIYRRTSQRVPGKKNPVVKRVDIALCTPMGREELGSRPDISISNCSCHEYGISRVLWAKRPANWMKANGTYCEALFLDAIHDKLPQSYILIDKDYSLPSDGLNIELRKVNLWEEYKAEGITIEALELLRSITLIHYPDHDEITAPTEEQEELLKKLGVKLF